jgi:hypothetical protein
MVPLYAPIRHKLTTALGAWHPSDASALALLSPWRRVFSDADWEALLSRCILPKLGWALSQLTINPADQRTEPLQWALAWAAAVPARHMATLLEQARSRCAIHSALRCALSTLLRAELLPQVARGAAPVAVCGAQLRRGDALVSWLEGPFPRRGASLLNRPAALRKASRSFMCAKVCFIAGAVA